ERVTAMWNEYVTWWQRDFRHPLPEPRRKQAAREPQPPPVPEPRAPAPAPARPCGSRGGEIQGLVTDQSGAALPGAQLQATNTASRESVFVTTGADGAYRVCGLQPGQYDLRADLTGFSTVMVARVAVAVGHPVSVPVTMRVGAIEESITV